MNIPDRQVDSQASIYNDLHSLDRIRQQAKGDQRAAIKAAAKEFEAFFMNMMLKSMRQASEVIGDDSMFGSQQEKMFVGMLDEQLSVDLSQKGNLGIAELLTRDLLGENLPNNSSRGLVDLLPREAKTNPANIKLQNIDASAARLERSAEVEQNDTSSINANVTASHQSVTEINQSNYLNKIATVEPQYQVDMVKQSNSFNPEIKSDAIAEKKSLFDSAEEFISRLLPKAEKIASDLGVDPKLLLAQAALETGWGKYIMHDQSGKPSYNLFGIKDGKLWQGESVKADTLEVEQGTIVKRQENFRMYESFEQSFQDYVNFVKSSPRYQQAIDAVENAKEYIRKLSDSGYATDPNYAEKIINIYENGIKRSSVFK